MSHNYRPRMGWWTDMCINEGSSFPFLKRYEILQGHFLFRGSEEGQWRRGTRFWLDKWCLNIPLGVLFLNLSQRLKILRVQCGRTSRVRIGILRCSYRLKIKTLVIGKNFFNSFMDTSCRMRGWETVQRGMGSKEDFFSWECLLQAERQRIKMLDSLIF